jgi:hypothetical protein
MRKQKSKKDDSGLFEVCWETVLLFGNFQTFIVFDILNKMFFFPSAWHAKTLPFTDVLLTEEADFYKLGDTHLSSPHSGRTE